MAYTNPLKGFMNIRRNELPLVILMFLYFFLVITTFWILKPIKKTLFVGYYKAAEGFALLSWTFDPAQAEQLAKVMNMVVAICAVAAFTALARHLRRQQLTYVFSGFCAACFVLFRLTTDAPGGFTVWAFYLFGDLFNTLMVATFFAFLNDSFRPESARRTYGAVILGGVCGGAVGSLVVAKYISELSLDAWMYVCLAVVAVITVLASAAGRLVDNDPPPEQPKRTAAAKQSSAALEGGRLVLRSPYLLAITGMVAVYEIVSTVLDFQFTKSVLEYAADSEIGEHFSNVYLITNVSALVLQLFATSFVLTHFRLSTALLITPVAIMAASSGFLALPILFFGSALSVADNALSYSLNQSARETLYTPTSADEKYKAKAFIDMFVQRAAKAVAVGVTIGLTSAFTSFSAVRFLSLLTIAGAALWAYAALYAGRRFEEMTHDQTHR